MDFDKTSRRCLQLQLHSVQDAYGMLSLDTFVCDGRRRKQSCTKVLKVHAPIRFAVEPQEP